MLNTITAVGGTGLANFDGYSLDYTQVINGGKDNGKLVKK